MLTNTVINADQTITFTPNKNASGEGAFGYALTDGNIGGESNFTSVAVNIEPGWGIAEEIYSSKAPIGTVKGAYESDGSLAVVWEQAGLSMVGNYNVIMGQRFEKGVWSKGEILSEDYVQGSAHLRAFCVLNNDILSIVYYQESISTSSRGLWSNLYLHDNVNSWSGPKYGNSQKAVEQASCTNGEFVGLDVSAVLITEPFQIVTYSPVKLWYTMDRQFDSCYDPIGSCSENRKIQVRHTTKNGDIILVFFVEFSFSQSSIWFKRFVNGAWQLATNLEVTLENEVVPSNSTFSSDDNYASLVEDDKGNLTVFWSRNENPSDNTETWSLWTNRYDVVKGWGVAKPISMGMNNRARLSKAVADKDGDLTVVWPEYNYVNGQVSGVELWSKRYNSETDEWVELQRLDNENLGIVGNFDLVVDSSKKVSLSWTQQNGENTEIWFRQYLDGNWTLEEEIPFAEIGNNYTLITMTSYETGGVTLYWKQYPTTKLSEQSYWSSHYIVGTWTKPTKAASQYNRTSFSPILLKRQNWNDTYIVKYTQDLGDGSTEYSIWMNDHR